MSATGKSPWKRCAANADSGTSNKFHTLGTILWQIFVVSGIVVVDVDVLVEILVDVEVLVEVDVLVEVVVVASDSGQQAVS